MSLEKFISKSAEIAEQQAGENFGNSHRGYKLVRASEFGIHFPPGSPRHLTEPRIWKMPTNTPAGIALWEAQAAAVQVNFQPPSLNAPKQETTNPPTQIQRS